MDATRHLVTKFVTPRAENRAEDERCRGSSLGWGRAWLAALALWIRGGRVERAGAGGALYRWESADGTVSFTDDAKRVPERYRESATPIDTSVLSDYGRYTPTDAAASQE